MLGAAVVMSFLRQRSTPAWAAVFLLCGLIGAEAGTIKSWDKRVRAAGMDDHQRDTLIKMFQAYASYGLKGNPNVLSWLLGRAPTSLAAFAARVAASQA